MLFCERIENINISLGSNNDNYFTQHIPLHISN